MCSEEHRRLLLAAGLPNSGAAFGVQNADDVDGVRLGAIKNREREAVKKRAAGLAADQRSRFGITGYSLKGGADAESEVGFESWAYLLVPADRRHKVALGGIFNHDAGLYSVASQASTSSHGVPGGISPRS